MLSRNRMLLIPGAGIALLLSACNPAAPEANPSTPAEIAVRIQSTENLTMVHIWATWCDPCREEFPELVRIMNEYPELEILLISADDPEKSDLVEAFLQEYGSPVGSLVSTELSQEFIEVVSPTWNGSLPATFFYQNGKIVSGWEGKRTYSEFAETIGTLLNK